MSARSIAVNWPSESLRTAFESGEYGTNSTEPWTQELLAQFVRATGAETVLELGCFKGHTTAWLATALQSCGGGRIFAIDCDEDRCRETEEFLARHEIPDVEVEVIAADAIAGIRSLPDFSIDFAFIDDKIDARHMKAELETLWSWYDPDSPQKMSVGGLIAVHDISHDDVASAVIGHQGYLLNTARMHLHGGLGLVQIPTR